MLVLTVSDSWVCCVLLHTLTGQPQHLPELSEWSSHLPGLLSPGHGHVSQALSRGAGRTETD